MSKDQMHSGSILGQYWVNRVYCPWVNTLGQYHTLKGMGMDLTQGGCIVPIRSIDPLARTI